MTRCTGWPTGRQDEIRARVAEHRAADRIVQDFRYLLGYGGPVGCALGRYDKDEYARVLGIPLQLAHLVDAIHEGLTPEESLDWPQRVVDAIRPGADTSAVWTRFAIWLLTVECPSPSGDIVAALYERRLSGDEPTHKEWHAMERAMENAAVEERTLGPTTGSDRRWPAWVASRVVTAALRTSVAADAVIEAAWVGTKNTREGDQIAFWTRMADALIEILDQCR